MEASFVKHAFTILAAFFVLSAIIILLPLYREWEGKKKAKALKKKLELQKRVRSFQERRRRVSSPQIEISAAN